MSLARSAGSTPSGTATAQPLPAPLPALPGPSKLSTAGPSQLHRLALKRQERKLKLRLFLKQKVLFAERLPPVEGKAAAICHHQLRHIKVPLARKFDSPEHVWGLIELFLAGTA